MIESFFLPALLIIAQAADTAPEEPASAAQTLKPPQALTQQDRAALRCSAAFALAGARAPEADGEQDVDTIKERGREFFVQSLATIMDERGLDRAAIEQAVRAEAQSLSESQEVDAVMPACLLMLQASGL
ncbi:MAG: hypothetical protein AAFZ11_09115 [Pseudomonadota bacterium]